MTKTRKCDRHRYKWTGGLTMNGLKVIPGGGCTVTRNGETTAILDIHDMAAWLTDHPGTPPWDVGDICTAIGIYYCAPPPYIAVDWHAAHGPLAIKQVGSAYMVEPPR